MAWPSDRSRDGGIDEIPLPHSPGRMWLCGKHLIGPDPDLVLSHLDATTVVCLTHERELGDRYPSYVEWLRANDGVRAVWLPIEDLHAPSIDEVSLLVADLAGRLAGGERIIVHCAAGIGRSGTVATCVLLDLGVALDDALRHVAANRPMAGPEVGAQRDLVHAYAAMTANR